MRIGTYDGSVPKIRVTGNPLDYFELRFHNPDGIKNLRRLPGKSFSLDRYGIPTTRRAGVVQYIAGLYRINEALALAIRVRERPGLRNEVHNFLTLNRDLKLPEEDAPKKRRDLCEFYLKFKFLHPLAMIGILSADPAYTATILSAENFGIKDKDPEVRLASVRILSEFVTNIWSRFKEAKESGTLPVLTPGSFAHLINAITFEDLNDDLQSLETISNAITQQGFGVFDKNSDVKSMAEIVAENIFKTQKIIRRYINEQGYSFSDNLTN